MQETVINVGTISSRSFSKPFKVVDIYLDNRKAARNQQEKDSAAGKKTFDDRNAAPRLQGKEFSMNKKALDDREAALAKKEKERSA